MEEYLKKDISTVIRTMNIVTGFCLKTNLTPDENYDMDVKQSEPTT